MHSVTICFYETIKTPLVNLVIVLLLIEDEKLPNCGKKSNKKRVAAPKIVPSPRQV